MRKDAVALIVGVFAILAVSATAATPNWTGTWDSRTGSGNHYIFEFTQSGSTLTGSYYGAGSPEDVRDVSDGVVSSDGRTLKFLSDNRAYQYEFTMNADGESFTGKWGYYGVD